MSKVYSVERGVLNVAMPNLKRGTRNKRVQGGHPPVPYRQHSGNLGKASPFARVPQQGIWAD